MTGYMNTKQKQLLCEPWLYVFSPLSCNLTTALSLYLWAVKWGDQRKSRMRITIEGKMAGSIVIELNCAPGLLQACVVMGGRADSHTHWQMDKPFFLFISPLQTLRQNHSDFTCTHIRMWLLCPLSVCSHLLAHFLLPVCLVNMHIVHACGTSRTEEAVEFFFNIQSNVQCLFS